MTLYDSTNYDTYVTFLNGNEASNKVDEDVSYLTQGTLDNFIQQVKQYDKGAIYVKLSLDEAPSVANQAIAFCIGHKDYGLQCGTASTGSETSISEYRTYWMPYSMNSSIKDDSPLDLWDAANDQYMVTQSYFGIDQFKLSMASSVSMVGNKFLYREPGEDQEIQWKNVKDYRFKKDDEVSVYRLQQSKTGVLSWDWDEDRTLQGNGSATMLSFAAATIATSMLFF